MFFYFTCIFPFNICSRPVSWVKYYDLHFDYEKGLSKRDCGLSEATGLISSWIWSDTPVSTSYLVKKLLHLFCKGRCFGHYRHVLHLTSHLLTCNTQHHGTEVSNQILACNWPFIVTLIDFPAVNSMKVLVSCRKICLLVLPFQLLCFFLCTLSFNILGDGNMGGRVFVWELGHKLSRIFVWNEVTKLKQTLVGTGELKRPHAY